MRRRPRGRRSSARPALAVRKAAHGALAKVSEDIEKLRFNRCVAHIYEFANALSAAIGEVGGERRRDAGFRLGHARGGRYPGEAVPPDDAAPGGGVLGRLGTWRRRVLVAEQPWPEVEPDLLIEDTITLPVQVNGKKRAEVTVARDASKFGDRGCRSGARCGKTGA